MPQPTRSSSRNSCLPIYWLHGRCSCHCSVFNVIHYFPNNDRKDEWGETASPCKVSWLSVIPLPRYADISLSRDGGRRHLGFLKFLILTVGRVKRVELRHLAKFRRNRPNRYRRHMAIFRFFQDGGRPPSWICYVCVRTIHEGHLVVFIAVQNL